MDGFLGEPLVARVPWGLVAQLLVNGLIAGTYYALLGASWSVIFGTTRVFHFAHGFTFVAAAYTAVMLTSSLSFPLWLASLCAVLVAILVGCLIEVTIYRPLRKATATRFAIFIASLGVLIFGQNLVQILFSPRFRSLSGFPIESVFAGPVVFTNLNVFELVVSLGTILAMWLFLKNTRAGTGIRAVASNPDMAQLLGIDRDRSFLLVFGLGSAAVAVAAVPYTLEGAATPAMGMEPLFIAFMVTIIGGIGNIAGALVGGLIIGLTENLAMLWFSSDWKVVVTFLVLLVAIILRPQGLFGKKR